MDAVEVDVDQPGSADVSRLDNPSLNQVGSEEAEIHPKLEAIQEIMSKRESDQLSSANGFGQPGQENEHDGGAKNHEIKAPSEPGLVESSATKATLGSKDLDVTPHTDEGSEDIPAAKIVKLDEVFDVREYQRRLIKTATPTSDKKRQSNAALRVRRIIGFHGDYQHTKIDIKSEALYEVLLEINKDVRDLEIRMKPPVASPELFFYSLHGLKCRLHTETLKLPRDRALISDLKAAVAITEEHNKDIITTAQNLSEKKEMSWDLLWIIFRPNTLLYTRNTVVDADQVLKLLHCKRKVCNAYGKPHERHNYWLLTCHYFGMTATDGRLPGSQRISGHCTIEFQINEYSGVMEITKLEAYPLQYKQNRANLVEQLINRGRKYASVPNIAYYQYEACAPTVKGASVDDILQSSPPIPKNDSSDDTKTSREEFHATRKEKLMIDLAGYRLKYPESKLLPRIIEEVPASSITKEDCLICSPVVFGFSFKSKSWEKFDVSRLTSVKFNDDAFESLVIDPGRKSIIKSLVRQHAKKLNYDGTIEGKGQGLIGLFAGGPGCGKTLTAEAVAEETRKPLYMVSAGELGFDPKSVDDNLSRILQRSYRWDAIVLLDEADVFLQRRNRLDVLRNAMVSIFLRELEYFKGILILTTNRVDDCDPAFESRIHFSMYYPELGYEARKSIWRGLLQKSVAAEMGTHAKRELCSETHKDTPRQPNEILGDEPLLHMLAKHPLNGRQIQNTVRTSNTLAQEEGVPLRRCHLESVLEVGTAWTALRSGQGKNEGQVQSRRYSYARMMLDFTHDCWQNWLISVPGSFPGEAFLRS